MFQDMPQLGAVMKVRPFVLHSNPQEFLKDSICESIIEGSYLYALLKAMEFLTSGDWDETWGQLLASIVVLGVDGANDEESKMIGEMNERKMILARHAIELLVAGNGKKLRIRNIKTYYQAADQEITAYSTVLAYANWYGPLFKVGDEVRSVLTRSNKWTSYRVKRFSAASLALKLYDSYPDIVSQSFAITRDEILDIDSKSHDMTQSDRIPDSMKAVTYLFLQRNGMLPENWYQGSRAYDDASVAMLKKWKNLFQYEKVRDGQAIELLEEGATMRDAAVAFGIIG